MLGGRGSEQSKIRASLLCGRGIRLIYYVTGIGICVRSLPLPSFNESYCVLLWDNIPMRYLYDIVIVIILILNTRKRREREVNQLPRPRWCSWEERGLRFIPRGSSSEVRCSVTMLGHLFTTDEVTQTKPWPSVMGAPGCWSSASCSFTCTWD